MLRKIAATATALAALALPSAASAGVTLQPDAAPAGKFTRLDVRVPTERDVATKRVVLELAPGFAFASYQPVPGWRIEMTQRALAQPLTIDGQSFDHEISRVTWTADSAAARIPPGGFEDFGLAVRVPDGEPGAKLTFTATQTYADGTVVHFADAADTATAAPQVTLNDALDPSEAAKRSAAPVATAKGDAPSRDLVIAALAAGGLGLLLGLAGFVRSGAR